MTNVLKTWRVVPANCRTSLLASTRPHALVVGMSSGEGPSSPYVPLGSRRAPDHPPAASTTFKVCGTRTSLLAVGQCLALVFVKNRLICYSAI